MPIAVGTKAAEFRLKTSAGEGLKEVGLGGRVGIRGLAAIGIGTGGTGGPRRAGGRAAESFPCRGDRRPGKMIQTVSR